MASSFRFFIILVSIAELFFITHNSYSQRSWQQSEGKVLVFYDQLSTNLSDAQIRFVAQHACGTQKVPRSFINRIRAYNPNFKNLHYELAFGSGSYVNLEGESWITDWTNINPHEDWFLHDCSNHRCFQRDWNWYFMDPSGIVGHAIPGWKEYWAQRAVRRMRLNDCDGIFADSHILPWNMNYYPCNFEPPDHDVELGKHFVQFDKYQMTMLHTDSTNFKYIPNIGQLVTTRDTTDYSNCDGAMLENFALFDCLNHFDPADWILEVDRVMPLSSAGKILIFQHDVDYWSSDCRMWFIANYFLMKNRSSYINLLFDWCGDLIPNWLAEYEMNLGTFTGSIPTSASEMFDAGMNVYVRKYEKGLVLVNNSNASQSISFPKTYYRVSFTGGGCVHDDGSFDDPVSISYQPTTGFTMQPMTAAIITYTADTTTQTAQATNLKATHRSGQTFLTWNEATGSSSSDSYRIYRHTAPINASNISNLTPLVTVPHNSGFYSREADRNFGPHSTFFQRRFIINDLGDTLANGVGLFVNTIRTSGNYYYAVTYLNNGAENNTTFTTNTLTTPVIESPANPKPVLVWQSPDKKGRIYTQFMDYVDWNPSFEGYAYNYAVSVPPGYSGQSIPLTVILHGWNFREGGYGFFEDSAAVPWGWNTAVLYIDDIYCTWYQGFSKTGNPMGVPDFQIPTSGPIRNYSEERIMRAVYDILHDINYNIDTTRIYVQGHSMGASGALGLAMHYGNIFAAVYCSEPMTNWITSGAHTGGIDWIPDVETKWGTVASNFAIENSGKWSDPIQKYNGWKVWDWTNRQAMLDSLKGLEMAFIVTAHGTRDDVIDFETQAQPFYEHYYSSKRAFAGAIVDADHTWIGFDGRPPNYQPDEFLFRRNEAIPAIGRASNSIPVPPPGVGQFNTDIEWSSSWLSFDGSPIDNANMFRITLRSTSTNQTADITPRRLQQFKINPYDTLDWHNIRMTAQDTIAKGYKIADRYGLVTIDNFQISTEGNRLLIRRHTGGATSVAMDNQPENYSIKLSAFYDEPFLVVRNRGELYDGKIKVYDLLGRPIIKGETNRGMMRLSNISRGTYFVVSGSAAAKFNVMK